MKKIISLKKIFITLLAIAFGTISFAGPKHISGVAEIKPVQSILEGKPILGPKDEMALEHIYLTGKHIWLVGQNTVLKITSTVLKKTNNKIVLNKLKLEQSNKELEKSNSKLEKANKELRKNTGAQIRVLTKNNKEKAEVLIHKSGQKIDSLILDAGQKYPKTKLKIEKANIKLQKGINKLKKEINTFLNSGVETGKYKMGYAMNKYGCAMSNLGCETNNLGCEMNCLGCEMNNLGCESNFLGHGSNFLKEKDNYFLSVGVATSENQPADLIRVLTNRNKIAKTDAWRHESRRIEFRLVGHQPIGGNTVGHQPIGERATPTTFPKFKTLEKLYKTHNSTFIINNSPLTTTHNS